MQELDPQNNPYANPYAAPQSSIYSPPPLPQQEELADRGIRLIAAILDSVLYVFSMAPGMIFLFMVTGKQNDNMAVAGAVVMAAGLIGYIVYSCYLLHENGQTVGKKIMKIKVTRTDGSRVGLSRYIFMRIFPVALLGAVPFIGFVFSLIDPLMIFRSDQRCLHDLVADTIVIKA